MNHPAQVCLHYHALYSSEVEEDAAGGRSTSGGGGGAAKSAAAVAARNASSDALTSRRLLTAALPGVAFVVGNKHRAAHTGAPGCVHGRRKGEPPQRHCTSERDVVAPYGQRPIRRKKSR